MAYNAKKTEHAGPKKGSGAFYGRKALAKKAGNRRRREADRDAVSAAGLETVALSTNGDFLGSLSGLAPGSKRKAAFPRGRPAAV